MLDQLMTVMPMKQAGRSGSGTILFAEEQGLVRAQGLTEMSYRPVVLGGQVDLPNHLQIPVLWYVR